MAEITRILLIRHGRQNSPLCNVDVPLAEEGRRQARLLGHRLADSYKIEAVWSSDLLRAVETADLINEYLKVPRRICQGIREISFGDLEGLSDQAIGERFGNFLKERGAMKRDMAYPGGECGADVVKRAVPVLEEIIAQGYEQAALVTHGGVIRSLLCHYLGADLGHVPLFAWHLENSSITELVYRKSDERMLLNRFNDYAHLEGEPELLRSGWSGKK